MSDWQSEVEELHEFFEGYFLGTLPVDDVSRLEAALEPEFSIVGPDASTSDRDQTIAAIRAGHAHTDSLTITITDQRLLAEIGDTVVATYVENHQLTERTNHRLATVVFRRDPAGPNGLRWIRVHETWVDGQS